MLNNHARLLKEREALLEAVKRLARANEADYEQCPGMDVKTAFETNSQALAQARSAISLCERKEGGR